MPTVTFRVAVGGDDGHTKTASTVYSPNTVAFGNSAGTTCQTNRSLDVTNYALREGIFRGDTSAILDKPYDNRRDVSLLMRKTNTDLLSFRG